MILNISVKTLNLTLAKIYIYTVYTCILDAMKSENVLYIFHLRYTTCSIFRNWLWYSICLYCGSYSLKVSCCHVVWIGRYMFVSFYFWMVYFYMYLFWEVFVGTFYYKQCYIFCIWHFIISHHDVNNYLSSRKPNSTIIMFSTKDKN